MNAHDENRIQQLLKQALPPVELNAEPNAEPEHDLWPAVLRKLDDNATASRLKIAVPWFDWALLAALAVFAIAFPATIPVFLYYL